VAGDKPPVGKPLPPRYSISAGETPEPVGDEEFVEQLRRAAHQVMVARPIPGEEAPVGADGLPEAGTVLAGYHWFGDWGRDTFIALPGLAQATGRYDECRRIVRTFAKYVSGGMLPNRFPDTGAPLNDGDYNTVDATLWYFHAIHVLDRLSGGGLVPEVYGTLVEIIDQHVKGTRFGIQVDPTDGLLRVENPQLTWMDAKVGDWVCTPRDGKPVEIAALWHHALSLMEVWARLLGRPMAELRRFNRLRIQAAEGFSDRFWNGAGGYLYDAVDGSAGDDASLRPNQIIAAALPDAPLSLEERKSIVDVVVSKLWTPRGLRTLDPADGRYRGRYEGDVWSRDGAYHQGTVWPWPLGPLVDAHLLVYGDKAAARKLIEPLREHLLDEGCVGSINEIFDGDAPHIPRGAVAQAWSVSEVFRAWTLTSPGGAPSALPGDATPGAGGARKRPEPA
jgi:glycogen debranching enzyme